MQPLLGQHRDVSPAGLAADDSHSGITRHRATFRVDGHRERELRRVIAHDVHRPDGHVLARRDPEEVDEGNRAPHGQTKPHVVVVLRVRPPISVAEQPVAPDRIVVGWLFTLHRALVRILSGISGRMAGLKMPCIDTNGTRRPSSSKPLDSSLKCKTSPCIAV